MWKRRRIIRRITCFVLAACLCLFSAPFYSLAASPVQFWSNYGQYDLSSDFTFTMRGSCVSSIPVSVDSGSLSFSVGANEYSFNLGTLKSSGSIGGSSTGSGYYYDPYTTITQSQSTTSYTYLANGQILTSTTSNGNQTVAGENITDHTSESYNLSISDTLTQYSNGSLSSTGFNVYSSGNMNISSINFYDCVLDPMVIWDLSGLVYDASIDSLSYFVEFSLYNFSAIPFSVYFDDPSGSVIKLNDQYYFNVQSVYPNFTSRFFLPKLHFLFASFDVLDSFSVSCSFRSAVLKNNSSLVVRSFERSLLATDQNIYNNTTVISQDLKAALEILQQANSFTPTSEFTGGTSQVNSGTSSIGSFENSMGAANQAAITASGISSFNFGSFAAGFALLTSVTNRLYDLLPADFKLLLTAILLVGACALVLNVSGRIASGRYRASRRNRGG